jgi:hypothetical protein
MSNSSNKKKKKRRSLLVQKRGYPFSYIIWSSSFPEMATFVEGFLYPLYLLLIGAVVSGAAVALLSHFLENRRKTREFEVERKRKELEIKVDIVSKITEVYGSVSAKVVVSTVRRKPISNIDEAVEKFLGDGDIVHSLLRSYYSSGTGITNRWYDFASAYFAFADATSLYFVKDPTDDEKKSQLKRHLNDVKKYFSDNKKIKWDRLTPDMPYDAKLWVKINDLYGDRVSEIITDVLKRPIKVF